ncbi:MAG: hypothetical protein ACJAZ2_000319 [Glaciecola sp.]|jgi:hypothetical protein
MKKIIKGLFAIVAVTVILTACSSSKKASHVDPVEQTKVDNAQNEEDNRVELLTFKRTSCYGRCPVYDLKIYADKTCEIDGKLFFIVEGKHDGELTQIQYDKIIKTINDIKYFTLNDVYDDRLVQDIAATFITVTMNGKTKSIKSRYGSPKELRDFLTAIHELAKLVEWKKK